MAAEVPFTRFSFRNVAHTYALHSFLRGAWPVPHQTSPYPSSRPAYQFGSPRDQRSPPSQGRDWQACLEPDLAREKTQKSIQRVEVKIWKERKGKPAYHYGVHGPHTPSSPRSWLRPRSTRGKIFPGGAVHHCRLDG
jgi:hypothetical protein